MKIKRIIGLPAIVSPCYRIVIDKALRHQYGIEENTTLTLKQENHLLKIKTDPDGSDLEHKSISIGRFNLPISWAQRNGVQIGDCVFVLPTSSGIIIFPPKTEFLFLGREN